MPSEHWTEHVILTNLWTQQKKVSRDLLTFSLPVPNQVRPGGRPLLRRTHYFEVAAVSFIGVIDAVVLPVARQRRVDATSCRHTPCDCVFLCALVVAAHRRRDASLVSKHHLPLSHLKSPLQSMGANPHPVGGWQGLSSVSSALQAPPPNWDGLWRDRVRNCMATIFVKKRLWI